MEHAAAQFLADTIIAVMKKILIFDFSPVGIVNSGDVTGRTILDVTNDVNNFKFRDILDEHCHSR